MNEGRHWVDHLISDLHSTYMQWVHVYCTYTIHAHAHAHPIRFELQYGHVNRPIIETQSYIGLHVCVYVCVSSVLRTYLHSTDYDNGSGVKPFNFLFSRPAYVAIPNNRNATDVVGIVPENPILLVLHAIASSLSW